MIFKGIPKALAGNVVKTVTPQEGGSTEPTGALAKLIEQNPEIIDRLKKPVEKSSPNNSIRDLPFYDDFQAYRKRLDEEALDKGELRAGTAALTPVEYEGVVYTFGGGLEASDFKNFLKMRAAEQRAAEQNQPEPEIIDRAPVFPANPPPTQNPFQRPVEALPTQRPVEALPTQNPFQGPMEALPYYSPLASPMDRSSLFFQRPPANNLVLTPAEALARARNVFIRSS
jgi:hypothetical protein